MGRAFVDALHALEASGHLLRELTLSGGQCADPLWNQYKADISGRILKVPEIIHAELAGNAVLCEAALGSPASETIRATAKSIRETAVGMIHIRETYTPKG
jgi:sugar (pentulose or hexulose) kinase